MAETVEQHDDTGLLPADPAGLRLSLSVESWPAGPGGRGVEHWSLLARHERLAPGQLPSRTVFGVDLAHVGVISLRRIPLARGLVDPAAYDELTGRAREPALDQELLDAVAEQVFTRRDGRHRLAPAVRDCLGKGPRADVGDLLVLEAYSITADWAVQDLDLLLLGEALARASAAGPCFVATAPSFLRTAPGEEPRVLGALRRAGFRPLAGLVMVAPGTGVPRLTGRGSNAPTWRHRAAP
ncbi:hypothetical protein ACGF12_22775 [Kitasatospora sp. NPDC048296]|uniref:hypothetical protein n=1 Tax=Kitasatospora sp. NPDC048296 TaxID=3364048 RepID=UPI003713A50E